MKSELFKNELKTITSDDIRDFAKVVLDDAPDYFFKVAASSTGKYHQAYALGDGGLMRHTKAVLRIYNYIIGLEQYQTFEYHVPNKQHVQDLSISHQTDSGTVLIR